ncbi:MAG TPA: rhodanese-like domain-containing protein [Burkholderiales bacterium]
MREISATELAAWLADAGRARPLLLDVREPWEYEKARIAGARLVPLREVPARLSEIEQDQDVVAICHHGGRSRQVALFLEKAGYSKVHNLAGGVDAWSRTIDPSVPLY